MRDKELRRACFRAREERTSIRASGEAAALRSRCAVPCPPCATSPHAPCATFLRRHAQLSASVYTCDNRQMSFTHPEPTPRELARHYIQHAVWRGTSKSKAHTSQGERRSRAQHAYIQRSGVEVSHSETALVVEMGCNNAELISLFGRPRRTLVCFEPSNATPLTNLQASGAARYTWIQSLFDPQKLQSALERHERAPPQINASRRIDFFLSSHVVEHVTNLCRFASELFVHMAPGGVVFTEIPTHTHDYVARSSGHIFGELHVSFPTPAGFLRVMTSAGFVLAQMSLVKNETAVAGNGRWFRSIFVKPASSACHGLKADVRRAHALCK